jgi:hypothetical protein
MNLPSLTCVAALFFATTSVHEALAQPYLGLRLTTQRWTPLRPVDKPVVEIDDDDIISQALDKAAQTYSAKVKDSLTKALSKADLLAKGVTLYDVQLDLKKPYLTIGSFEGVGTTANPLRTSFSLAFADIGMTARSTTPDVAGGVGVTRAADPRCEIRFSAQLNMQVGVTNTLNAPLLTDLLDKQTKPVIEITQVTLIGRNFGCSAPVAVANTIVNLTGIRDQINALARVALSELSKDVSATARPLLNSIVLAVNAQARAKLEAATRELAEINPPDVANLQKSTVDEARKILQSIPSNMLAQGWLTDEGRGKKLVINIAPAAPIRDLPPQPFVALSGPFQVGEAIGASGTRVSVKCESLPIQVQRVTGPRRMLNAAGALGNMPLETLKVTTGCSNNIYSTSGLSAIFPHVVSFSSIGRKGPGTTVCQGILVTPQGWNSGDVITPIGRSKSYPVMVQYAAVPCGANQHAADLSVARKIDPRVNPPNIRDRVTDPVIRPGPGEATSINPQPLPPRVTIPVQPPSAPVLR